MFNLAFLILLTSFVFDNEIKFKRVKISDAISVSLPETFFPMSEQDISSRHISYRKPLAIYTSQERTVDFSVNTAVSQWPASDLNLMKGFYKASISSLFGKVEFIQDEIKVIDGKEFAVLEFISVTEDEEGSSQKTPLKNYTYAQYAIVDGKTLVFTFSCLHRQKDKWQPVAHQIMESIKIKQSRK